MRADAKENRDRLVEVAATAFAREGADASLKAIAAEAGVGIGTLYRRFPTRDALYVAVHRAEIIQIGDRAAELLAAHDAVEALRLWLLEFADFLLAKLGMAEVFRSVMSGGENPFLDLRVRTNDAAVGLLTAAGDRIRQDVAPGDLLVALHGITLATADREQAHRLVGLLVDGLVGGSA